jgi:hypothetical protein
MVSRSTPPGSRSNGACLVDGVCARRLVRHAFHSFFLRNNTKEKEAGNRAHLQSVRAAEGGRVRY